MAVCGVVPVAAVYIAGIVIAAWRVCTGTIGGRLLHTKVPGILRV